MLLSRDERADVRRKQASLATMRRRGNSGGNEAADMRKRAGSAHGALLTPDDSMLMPLFTPHMRHAPYAHDVDYARHCFRAFAAALPLMSPSPEFDAAACGGQKRRCYAALIIFVASHHYRLLSSATSFAARR